MQASGAAIAKQPLKTNVVHKHQFIHRFDERNWISVQRNETLIRASIGLYMIELA